VGEALFFVAFGRELFEDSIDVRLIDRNVVRWQEDGAPGETRFQGVVGDFGLTLGRGRAGGELRVGAVSRKLVGDAMGENLLVPA